MASKKNNITTSFSADVKDLKAGIQDAKAAIKLAKPFIKLFKWPQLSLNTGYRPWMGLVFVVFLVVP